jgi:predicted glycosyltransferase
VIVPDAIPIDRLEHAGARERKLFRYPGLKEDYYLADFVPDPSVLDELRIDRERVLAVVRPPPETSAYHASNPLYAGVIDRLAADPNTVAVIIPRTEAQASAVRARGDDSLRLPERAIDAQSLIAHADLVVSAGGTMNREAVALGVPVYTIFSGRMGAVDERLIAEGRMTQLADPAGLEPVRRDGPAGPQHPRDPQVLADAVLGALD